MPHEVKIGHVPPKAYIMDVDYPSLGSELLSDTVPAHDDADWLGDHFSPDQVIIHGANTGTLVTVDAEGFDRRYRIDPTGSVFDYPGGRTPVQNHQQHQVFMAGAFQRAASQERNETLAGRLRHMAQLMRNKATESFKPAVTTEPRIHLGELAPRSYKLDLDMSESPFNFGDGDRFGDLLWRDEVTVEGGTHGIFLTTHSEPRDLQFFIDTDGEIKRVSSYRKPVPHRAMQALFSELFSRLASLESDQEIAAKYRDVAERLGDLSAQPPASRSTGTPG